MIFNTSINNVVSDAVALSSQRFSNNSNHLNKELEDTTSDRINGSLRSSYSMESKNNNLKKKKVGLHGEGEAASLINDIDNAVSFSNNYLLDQKLKNSNTYNKLKSNIVFQNEFLSHIRLNQLK